MKKLICTSCGAPINSETFECDYCGSVFLSSSIENVGKSKAARKIDVPKISDEDLNNLIKQYVDGTGKGLISGIIFLLVWTGIAFSIAFSMLRLNSSNGFYGENGFMETFNIFEFGISIVPFLFAILGIVLIIINFVKIPSIRWKSVYKLLEEKKYAEAYELLEERERKKHNLTHKYVCILIGYYRLEKFDEVRATIINMPAMELSQLLHGNVIILNIASSLHIKTPDCQVPDCSEHNHSLH